MKLTDDQLKELKKLFYDPKIKCICGAEVGEVAQYNLKAIVLQPFIATFNEKKDGNLKPVVLCGVCALALQLYIDALKNKVKK